MAINEAQLDIDLEMLDKYIYAGHLNYINGEWRWNKNGFANKIVFYEVEARPEFMTGSIIHWLDEQGDELHSLTE
jgi:hypothetical protein